MQLAHSIPAESEESFAHFGLSRLDGTKECEPLRGKLAVREAILLLFRDSPLELCSRLQSLSLRQWEQLLRWLDFSGLTLYFFDRLLELQCAHWIPGEVMRRIGQNRADNSARTQCMIAESVSIQNQFQEAGLRYCNLKGASLWPLAVPRLELRNQQDLDYLVADEDAHRARTILEQRGYRLHPGHGSSWDVKSERVWEFRRNEMPEALLKDIYKPHQSFRVELHIESAQAGQRSLLDHTVYREMFGIRMPVLSPADLLIAQGLHAFKHVCRPFYRLSQLLEFRRHVMALRNEKPFWLQVRSLTEADPLSREGLGVVVLMITGLMGQFAPAELTSWTIDRLSPGVRFWVKNYARRSALASFPGTKLHLLLERELSAPETGAKRSFRQRLLPMYLPRAPVQPISNERFALRMRRYCKYFASFVSRLRFHTVEGLRCICQAIWFRRRVAEFSKGQF